MKIKKIFAFTICNIMTLQNFCLASDTQNLRELSSAAQPRRDPFSLTLLKIGILTTMASNIIRTLPTEEYSPQAQLRDYVAQKGFIIGGSLMVVAGLTTKAGRFALFVIKK